MSNQQPWGSTPQPGQPQSGQPQQPYGPGPNPAPQPNLGQPQGQPYGGQPAYGAPQQPYGQAPQQGFGSGPSGFQGQGQPAYVGAQPGYGQGGTPPPAAPKKGGSGKILALVLVPLLILAAIGGGFALLGGKGDKQPTPPPPTINPTTPTRSPAPTTSAPTTTAPASTKPASPSASKPASTPARPSSTVPTTSATTTPPSGAKVVEVGGGVGFRLPEGWTVDEQKTGAVYLTDGSNAILVQLLTPQKGAKATTLMEAWLTKQKPYFQNPQIAEVRPVTLKPAPAKAYNAADAGLAGTMTTQNASADVVLYSVVFVREVDGAAVAVTQLAGLDEADTVADAFTDVASDAATTLLS